MFQYYTAIILICWLTLFSLCVLVYKNNRISQEGKGLFYMTYLLIALSALAEWTGVLLNGRTELPALWLRLAKCADYILTPMAGGTLVMQMKLRNRWQRTLLWILACNTVLQVLSLPGGWMASVDAQNRYAHGPLFPLYFCVCLATYALIVLQASLYSQSFQRQNRSALFMVMLVVIVGIVLQELLPHVRTAYIAMTNGACLMFIHTSEFSQLAADSRIAEQQQALRTDPLTRLLSRYAYSEALKEPSAAALSADFAAFTIDVNGLKQVNDQYGHEAGDELLRAAAACICRTFASGARCYRTGGDEFVVMVEHLDAAAAEEALRTLDRDAQQWRGSAGQSLCMAAGYALSEAHPGLNMEELVRVSDMEMYEAKAAYYQRSGHDRRKRR